MATSEEDGLELQRQGDEIRFRVARNGDHFAVPFQCDLCQFRNIWFRNPVIGDHQALVLIRRAILDAFWTREPSTIENITKDVRKLLGYAELYGLHTMKPRGPFELGEDLGLRYAIALLIRSNDKGRKGTVSYETIRKQGTALRHLALSDVTCGQGLHGIISQRNYMDFSKSHTFGRLFQSFTSGLHKRLGHHPKQDKAISIEVILWIMRSYEEEYSEHEGKMGYLETAMAFMFVVMFCTGRRGFEMFALDLRGLREIVAKELELSRVYKRKVNYFGLPFVGRFKEDRGQGERKNFIPCAATTNSKLQPWLWTLRYLKCLEEMGIVDGWGIRNPMQMGSQGRSSDFIDVFHNRITTIQELRPELISPDINVINDYGFSRSCRRGSNTHARNQGVAEPDIEVQMHWAGKEGKNGKRLQQKMCDNYTDFRQAIPTLLRYSQAL